MERRRSLKPRLQEGGWTLGLVLGSVAAYWLASAVSDGSLAARVETSTGAWSHVAAVALLLVVGSQGWPGFVGGFAPAIGVGTIVAGILSRSAPDDGVSLLLPLMALGTAAAVATVAAMSWQQALRRGGR